MQYNIVYKNMPSMIIIRSFLTQHTGEKPPPQGLRLSHNNLFIWFWLKVYEVHKSVGFFGIERSSQLRVESIGGTTFTRGGNSVPVETQ